MDSLRPLLLFLLLTLSSSAASVRGVLSLPSDEPFDFFCEGWRDSVEANDFKNWRLVPARCADFVKQYIEGGRYKSDLKAVTLESLAFAKTVRVAEDGKDVWVFDVDETLLSNLPYYVDNGYGAKDDDGSWATWVASAKAPALKASLNFYNYLLGRGFQIFIITGRNENKRSSTMKNLKNAGYPDIDQKNVILRNGSDPDRGAVFKLKMRAKLVKDGYRIHGNSGDQWSDLFGTTMAYRSFKLPNPMYYIGN